MWRGAGMVSRGGYQVLSPGEHKYYEAGGDIDEKDGDDDTLCYHQMKTNL